MGDLLQIQQEGSPLYEFFKAQRVEIPLVTWEDHPFIEAKIDGDLPADLKEDLPIFATYRQFTGANALNSGGRGIVISDGERHYRIKAADLEGALTNQVARSDNNRVADVRLAAKHISKLFLLPETLELGGVYELPRYPHLDLKPFSFFGQEAVDNERHASQVIGDAFEKKGFFRPYTFVADVSYPKIQFQGEQMHSLVFELPTIESDLRFAELFNWAFLHLKYSSPAQIDEIKDPLAKFLTDITGWHGLVSKIMAANNLAPEWSSHQNQNFVLCAVDEENLGLSRVDHTSTVVDKSKALQHLHKVKSNGNEFLLLYDVLVQSQQLAKNNHKYDSQRYSSMFDAAYKWQNPEPFNIQIDGFFETQKEVQRVFTEGFHGKVRPIPVSEVLDLVSMISKIEIDQKWETKRQEKAKQFMTKDSGLRDFMLDTMTLQSRMMKSRFP